MTAEREERRPFRRLVRLGLVEADWVDADLARHLRWSTSRLSNYMTGKRRPNGVDLAAIAEALDLDVTELAASLDMEPGPAVAATSRNRDALDQMAAALEEVKTELDRLAGRTPPRDD